MGRCDGPIVPLPNGCSEVLYSSCIYYDGAQLCVDEPQAAYVNEVLAAMAESACNAPTLYTPIDYKCLADLQIETRDDFIMALVDIVCQILGTEVPGNVTSTSDILALIADKQAQINALNNFAIIGCYAPLSGLSGTSTLANIVESFQQVLCNLTTALASESDKFVKVSIADTTTGYLQNKLIAGTNVSISKINPNSNEKLLITATSGSITPVTVQDTTSVNMTALDANTIKADVKIDSTVIDNFLVITPSGLFVDIDIFYNYIINNPGVKLSFCSGLCVSSTTTTTTLAPTTTTTTTSTTTTTTIAPTTTTTTTLAPTTTTTSTTTTTTTLCPCITYVSFNVVTSGTVLRVGCDDIPVLESFVTGGQLVVDCVKRNSVVGISAEINNIVYSSTCCITDAPTTSTTTTTTTTVSPTTTSTTTTTTTASGSNVIFYGVQSNNTTPVTFSSSQPGNPASDIIVNYGSQPIDVFYYVAYPSSIAAKSNYMDENYSLNAGTIGGLSDLFELRAITYLGIPYYLIITRYETMFNGSNKLVKYYNI